MPTVTVWAPHATTMTLLWAGVELPMRRADGGWWAVEPPAGTVPASVDDVDYGFRIDGGPPRPDPRSRRQPHGAHGLSRTFDAAAHRWSDANWRGLPLAGAVLYELHIGTFTPQGTLRSAIDRLDYLADLGVDFVELMPVAAFNGDRNWGYDGVHWFAVHEPYGGPAAYQEFADACHVRGLGVIQDVVYNHLGPSGNYLPEFGPYLRLGVENGWGTAVNLDGPDAGEVRRYILDNARMWFEDYHADGLRLDAVHALVDNSPTPLLEELATETDRLAARLGRPLHLIAESDLNDARLVTAQDRGGTGLTAAWDDDVHHAIHVAVTGETGGYYADFAPLAALAKVLTRGYFHDGTFSSFRGRLHGRPVDTARLPAWRLVASIQNHDQVGNRAAGDRLAQQACRRAQAVAATLLLTSPFTPLLFMGEEWAASTPWPFFTSHPEPDLAEATTAGRLAEFAEHDWDQEQVPDPQDPATFESAVLNWAELSGPAHAQMLSLYRSLLRLRREHPGPVTDPWPDLRVRFDQDERWIVIHHGGLTVAANLAAGTQTVPVDSEASAARAFAVVTDLGVQWTADGRSATMPAMSAAVIA